MIYRELLVMRNALVRYAWILVAGVAFMLVSIALRQTEICGTTTELGGWLQGSSWAAMIFAAIFGVGLGNASRDGARVFWVLPEGRLRSALGLVGVDLVAVIVALALGFVGSTIVFEAGFAIQHSQCVVVNNLNAPRLFLAIGFPVAVYGWSTLTGMLLRRVAYMGVVFLPLGLLWLGFSQTHGGFGAFLRSIAFANPFIMVQNAGVWQLWGIVIATLAVALALWQRAEVVN